MVPEAEASWIVIVWRIGERRLQPCAWSSRAQRWVDVHVPARWSTGGMVESWTSSLGPCWTAMSEPVYLITVVSIGPVTCVNLEIARSWKGMLITNCIWALAACIVLLIFFKWVLCNFIICIMLFYMSLKVFILFLWKYFVAGIISKSFSQPFTLFNWDSNKTSRWRLTSRNYLNNYSLPLFKNTRLPNDCQQICDPPYQKEPQVMFATCNIW